MKSPSTKGDSWIRRRPELLTAAVCALLTGVHFAYRRVTSPAEPAPILVSTLSVGSVVRGTGLAAAPGEATCRVVITFSPDCPFCKRAAEREKQARRDDSYASSIWVTGEHAPSLEAFAERMPPRATQIVDEALYRSLGVRAVPGLYLLDAAGTVRWVGPYQGDEDARVLSTRCLGAPGTGVDAKR